MQTFISEFEIKKLKELEEEIKFKKIYIHI